MSLFKIFKGDSTRISTGTTQFHEGYAYFTPDDGKFYIDATVGSTDKRICINPASKAISATLKADGWSSGKQTLSITGMTPDTNGIIGVAQDITDTQMDAAIAAKLLLCSQDNGSITVAVCGSIPACDIPITIILVP